jgi:hypothetical protein
MGACLCATLSLHAAERARGPRADFLAAHPCPATGKSTGACSGYVIDHIIALPCGGADAPANMQWQTIAEARAKDRWETIGCRKGRRPQMVSDTPSPVEVYPCCTGDAVRAEAPADPGRANEPMTLEMMPSEPAEPEALPE